MWYLLDDGRRVRVFLVGQSASVLNTCETRRVAPADHDHPTICPRRRKRVGRRAPPPSTSRRARSTSHLARTPPRGLKSLSALLAVSSYGHFTPSPQQPPRRHAAVPSPPYKTLSPVPAKTYRYNLHR